MDIRASLGLILSTNHPRFSDCFYQTFFGQYPDVKKRFDGVDLKRQGVLLMIAVQVMVEHHLHRHLVMKNYLKLLGHRHRLHEIPVSDYPKFDASLLTALKTFHAELWNENLAAQWAAASTEAIQLMVEGHADDSAAF